MLRRCYLDGRQTEARGKARGRARIRLVQQQVAAGDVVLIVIGIMCIARMAMPVFGGGHRRVGRSVDLAYEVEHRPHENAQHQQQKHAAMQDSLHAGR